MFLVGGTQALFDSDVMNKFLRSLHRLQMKPFRLYLVRNTANTK